MTVWAQLQWFLYHSPVAVASSLIMFFPHNLYVDMGVTLDQ
jgi:hypothetical protein